MIGYHYTSKEHWEEIKKEGLKPSLIRHIELQDMFRKQIFGIWVWSKKQDIVSHFGNLIRVLSVHNSSNITLLSVQYEEKDVLKFGKRIIVPTHIGEIGSFIYHKDEPAHILTDTVPMSRIQLVKHYDLIKLINEI